MKNITEEKLEAARPKIDPRVAIQHCLDRLYDDAENEVDDLVVFDLTFEELIGALLLARDAVDEAGEKLI